MSSGIAVAVSGTGVDAQDDSELARATMRRVSLRLLPFLFTLYIVNYLDRSNVALAALTMNQDLQFSATVYGFGVSVFFVGYCLFDVPSNLILARVGARRWIGRIMISWGVIATAIMLSVRLFSSTCSASSWALPKQASCPGSCTTSADGSPRPTARGQSLGS